MGRGFESLLRYQINQELSLSNTPTALRHVTTCRDKDSQRFPRVRGSYMQHGCNMERGAEAPRTYLCRDVFSGGCGRACSSRFSAALARRSFLAAALASLRRVAASSSRSASRSCFVQ
jgi:hypothetical protein